jgi:hypothetical protein
VKRIGRDESMWVIMHIYIEIIQGSSLCSYLLSQMNKNCHVSLFYFLCFLFYNIREQESRTGSAGRGTRGGGREVGRRVDKGEQ